MSHHPWQWWTINRHTQPRNEQATPNRWFFFVPYAVRSVTPREHTFEYPIWERILLTLLIPSIAASYLVVILWSFRIWLSARCIVAGVTAVDGRPERGRSDTLLCPCSDDANRFAQRLTLVLTTAMSPQTFVKRLWIFVIDSFSAKRNSITALCLERASLTDSILKVHYFATI
jgi:hypothetical protein